MKYYMVTEGDSSGIHFLWSYYELLDCCTVEDAEDLYREENGYSLDAPYGLRIYSKEITEKEYHDGLHFNNYYGVRTLITELMFKNNIFPLKSWALMFANPKKPVRIGFPGSHLVYRMNDKRELSYQYDYDSHKFGLLPAFKGLTNE